MAKGRKTGGRVKGVPNKTTSDVRAVIALVAQRNVAAIDSWLNEVEDPAKRVELFLRMIEYHVPKLSAVRVDLGQMPVADILAELERRAGSEPDSGPDLGSTPGA